MSDSSQLLVRRIKDGTVIDHIESAKALLVLRALNITGKEGNVITVALNVPSSKHHKKDIIKVENRFLETHETNKLALIAPHIVGIFRCPNLKCITNSDENINPIIDIIDKEKIVLKCRYCARTLTIDELVF